MRIVIFEKDYSDINTVHNTIQRIAKVKEYPIYLVLTTRKEKSVYEYMKNYEANAYFITIDEHDLQTIELAKSIRATHPKAQIFFMTKQTTQEIDTLSNQLNSTVIEKSTITFANKIEMHFLNAYRMYIQKEQVAIQETVPTV